MDVRIKLDPECGDGIVIVCSKITPDVQKIEQFAKNGCVPLQTDMLLTLNNSEFFVPYREILFFESSGDRTAAHTADRMYYTDKRLHTLCDELPPSFFRVSKSCIVNIDLVSSLKRELTGICETSFKGSSKTVFVSRMYYKPFRERIAELRLK